MTDIKRIIEQSKSKYKTIHPLLNADTKDAGEFLKKFDEQKEKKKENWNEYETKFKNEWKELGKGDWDENKLREEHKIPENADVKKLTSAYNGFINTKREEGKVRDLASKSTIPVKIIIKCSTLNKPEGSFDFPIDNFPISTSEAIGGQQ